MTKKQSDKPWKKSPPKKSGHTELTDKSKKTAKKAAKKAGRTYPNLVDNMNAAKKQKSGVKSSKSKQRSR